ncbi:hypothetical protein FRC09_013032 [Ceratobasidium sp. 395]|nr:hypothetical protein FRC09_013032 [Ceratobasidium sp. 395]
MVLPTAVQSRVTRLNQRLTQFLKHPISTEQKGEKEKLLQILRDTCVLVREETTNQSPDLREVVETAQQILSTGTAYACGLSDMSDPMPSWAHDDMANQPLIEDPEGNASQNLRNLSATAVLELFRMFGVPPRNIEPDEMGPSAWSDDMKRHPKSSLLARPRPDLPSLTPTAANPVAMSVYDARCETKSRLTFTPIKLRLSQGNMCLALNGSGGWKNRSPALCYFLLDELEAHASLQDNHFLEPGLVDVAHHMALDESRQLIFVGDNDRVKSYAWATPDGENYGDEPLPTHTLDCPNRVTGPIAILPNGTVVRAGRGQVAVWDIDSLETHGEDGEEIIGKRDERIRENTSRDDPEELETSTGSPVGSYIKFAAHPDLTFAGWELLPQTSSTMLCHSAGSECFTIDLEHGGTVNAHYLGHGGTITDFSLSGGDPQIFLTACTDGFVRMFDRRTPLPVLTIEACSGEPCYAVALAHPDGIPTVFTGSRLAEQIKMWDVRARTPVYELATGNNRVNSLAWDPNRDCLYAATECFYKDRLGYHHEYQRSRKWKDLDLDEASMKDDVAWPKNAWHDEYYYGYTFDAGEHRIYRYAFKENPDELIMPEYGYASINESYW